MTAAAGERLAAAKSADPLEALEGLEGHEGLS
jgi:hypothetical protein